MKKWGVSFVISISICTLGLIKMMDQSGCINSGGRWLGIMKGCEGGEDYSIEYFSSALSVVIFLGIVLGVTSACVQFYDIFLNFNKKNNH